MIQSLRSIFTVLLLLAGFSAMAQKGTIYGKVINEKNEAEFGVTVEVSQGGLNKGGGMTDPDGEFTIGGLDPGQYDVKFSALNYKTTIINGVMVIVGGNTKLNHKLEKTSGKDLENVEVVAKRYERPLLDDKQVVTGEEMYKKPTRNTNDIISTQAGVYQAKANDGVSIGGARTSGTTYIVDGMVRTGNVGVNLPQGTIAQMQIFNSGVPAQYGDAMGGVVSITTRGVANTYQGGLMYERSVEGFGHNLLSFNLSGPFVTRTNKDGIKKALAGFLIGIEGLHDKDNDPYFPGNYYVKDDVLAKLQETPIIQYQTGDGSIINVDAAQFVTKDQMVYEKARRNALQQSLRGTGKLDFALSDNVTVTLGGTYNYANASNYDRYWSLFSLDALPKTKTYTAGGYLRLTQRFGKQGQSDEKSAISNAYYTLQADYQRSYSSSEHPNHKRNIFDYNYIGKFRLNESNFYQASPVDNDSLNIGTPTIVQLITNKFPNPIDFEASDKNPLLSKYTSLMYDYFNSTDGANPSTLTDIRANKGLLNGDVPVAINTGGFSNIGLATNGYNFSETDQFAVAADASFDLTPGKTRHSIQFGLYYQQRVQRGYSLTSSIGQQNSLWQIMRSVTNQHLNFGGDPYFIKDGKTYTYQDVLNGVVSVTGTDTMYYNTVATGIQANFDRNLREKLGLGAGNTQNLNVDEMDPSTFSLDMLSPDELLNSGRPFINYYGYDYLGNKNGNVSFNDYWTKKDARGNFAREVGAFRPNYIAGYIQDAFRFKDIEFRLGVRVDRYDANTKVLKDPYSLYETYTAGGIDPTKVSFINPDNKVPGSIGDEYIPYVDNNESARPRIIGYRNGDDWYDASGNLILDPKYLSNISGSQIVPYLSEDGRFVKVNDTAFNPNNSFTDYKPQVNVSPRVAFRFPIADQSLFFAHYDVLVQRPDSRVFITPDQYYFMAQNAGDRFNNPNMKPQKTFDYQIGFQQALSKTTALTLTGFYRERKDMVQMRQYYAAWPVTYNSYGNRDFSTTKGITLKFDRRRVNHLEFQLNYTLQFAEGTGSNDQSSANYMSSLIAAGLPNLRMQTPLSIDSRHNIVGLIDYRYLTGEGPEVFGSKILQNTGLNLIVRARSGEPYTTYAEPGVNVVKGSINGSRLPWHYIADIKLDKDFVLMKNRQSTKRPIAVNVFVLVQNLLNQRDVLGVYGYTARPDDDGYIASPRGQQQLSTLYQDQRLSYTDMYNISINNPNNYNLPRRINIGLSLNF